MSLSLNPASLARYYEISRVLYKHGRGDLLAGVPLVDDPLPHAPLPPVPPAAEELARDLEKLGPTFIKLGQLLSTRTDVIPPAYARALERLQDDVERFPFEQVQEIVSVETGVRLSKGFSHFEPEPIAAASLSQVHRAVTRSGQQVVVKVQRPGIREKVAEDLDALAEIAELLEKHTDSGRRLGLVTIVEELRKAMLRELDYRIEAANMRLMRNKLAEFPNILIPEPLEDYSSGRVLTMQYVGGQKITAYSPLIALDIDGPALAEELFRAYLHQILVVGVFHADPHPGNVFLTDDRRIALLDMGMVGHMGAKMQDSLLRLLGAIGEGDGDRAAEIAESIGEAQSDYDQIGFRRKIADLVTQQATASLDRIQIGRLVMDIQTVAAVSDLRIPPDFNLLGKTLLNLDLVGRTLAPEFEPNESIRRNLAVIAQQRMMRNLSAGSIIGTLMETKELVQKLPSRASQFIDLVANNQLRLKLDAIDENLFAATLQKIANRITLGLIIAALIVGAALLMRVNTAFTLFGYPGLAMICFLAATVSAIALAIQILLHDRRSR